MKIVLAPDKEKATRIVKHYCAQTPNETVEHSWVFVSLTEDEQWMINAISEAGDRTTSSPSLNQVLQKAIERVVIRNDDRHIFLSDTVLTAMTDHTYVVLRDVGGKTGHIAF